jgi:hypothetical protein
MVRASKLPFKNFEYNIQRATALAHLDGYLEDILQNEGKRTIGAFLNIPQELMQSFKIDKLMREFEKRLEEHFKAEYDRKGKQHFEDIAKDLARRLKPKIEKIAEIFEDLGLIMDQTLLEQALVVAVSAFEVYLKEIVVSIVTLNKSVRKRFHQEIDAELSLAKLQEYKEDAKRTQGEIVADRVRLDTGSIKRIFKKLIENENIFGNLKTERKVQKIFEKRHIIIHRAGTIDPKYKKVTKYKGAIDKQIKISRGYVLRSITLLKEVVNRIEASIH